MTDATLICHRDAGSAAAVVFIHGFLGDPQKTWGNFPKILTDQRALGGWDVYSLGYPTSAWFDLLGVWKANPDIDGIAGSLKTRFAHDPALKRYGAVAIVAHSMGGLAVQRALIDAPELVKRVDAVIFFGTPSGGLSKASFFAFWKPSLRDMEEGQPFITQLRADWTKTFHPQRPFRFMTVAGDQDEFVPRSSSLSPFAKGDCEVVPGDHLSIVKPVDEGNLSVQVVISVLTAGSAAGEAARAAVERLASRETVQQRSPNAANLDEKELVKLALALEAIGQQDRAIEILETAKPDRYDARGVLAGRLKRRWLVQGSAADGQRALDIYRDAFERAEANNKHAAAFYNGINYAFLTLAYGDDRHAARAIVQRVLVQCAEAQAETGLQELQWLRATEGEAQLILGNAAAALPKYREAAGIAMSPRERDSMFQQAVRVPSIFGDKATAEELTHIFGRDPES
ncbi:MAG: alpha/beta hydrolase [Acidobacteriota bacterium]